MTQSVEQARHDHESGPTTRLLDDAALAADAVRTAAALEADALVAAAAREAGRLLTAEGERAEEVRTVGSAQARALVDVAVADAGAEAASAIARSQAVIAAARRTGDRGHEEAIARSRRLIAAAERRAEELLAMAEGVVSDREGSAGELADRRRAGAAGGTSGRLEEARASCDAAAAARVSAERDARLMLEEAARRAAEMVDAARLDLEMARAVKALAERDAAEMLARAMEQGALALRVATGEFDAANALLAEQEQEALPATSEARAARELSVGSLLDLPAPVAAEPEPDAGRTAAGAKPGMPLLVPVLSFGRELIVRMLVLAGLITGAWFWLWWLAAGHGRWTFGSITATALLAWVFGLSGYFFFFVCRMSRPNPALAVPDLRVAMVVTKAPAEAWAVLQRTIQAMLDQDFPGPYDVWLADERPTLETLQWCLDHGVKVSTRHGVEEYHRPTWPRRTRSKEGNLAWFYDQVGYERYDVVVQLDADHVPDRRYLAAMVRPFVDPRVGYVSAPSVCDANAEEGWTVRGRLYREASMHGPVQAGCNAGYAPVCIGSHYAVRTAALRDVGGIGPELAEDYSTTLWFQSAGWDGVFNIDAMAHGDGPATVEEMLVQEVQWARSLGTILARWAPKRLRTVPWRARPRLAFALIYYPVNGLVVALAASAPVVGLLLRTSWGDTSLAAFYVHLWPHTVASMALVLFLRRSKVLRPVNGKVWSWELVLFQLVRWPWTLWGFVQGLSAGVRSKVVSFRVTPKSVTGERSMPVKYLGPTLVLGGIPALVVALVRDPGPAVGLMVLATLQAVVYLGCAVLVVALHLAGNARRRRLAAVPSADQGGITSGQAGRDAAAVTAAVVALAVAALVWRLWVVGLRP